MAATSNIRAGRAYVEVTAETSKLRQNLAAAQSQLKAFGKSCQTLGRDMAALGGALSLPFILAEKSFAGFDDKMRLVQAVTNSTGEQFDALTRTAQQLGRETSFTAQQVADAMIALGRMGFNPSEITAAVGEVLNLSRATGTDLAESADIAANSMRIFGMEAGKMGAVSDILTATANGSAQTLTDLFEGLKMAGPQAAAAGESLDEVCASLGVMANMGIKGSIACPRAPQGVCAVRGHQDTGDAPRGRGRGDGRERQPPQENAPKKRASVSEGRLRSNGEAARKGPRGGDARCRRRDRENADSGAAHIHEGCVRCARHDVGPVARGQQKNQCGMRSAECGVRNAQ